MIKGKSHRKESERNTDGPNTIQPIQDSLLLAEKSIKHNSITEHDNPEQSSQTKPKESTGNMKVDEKNNSLGEVAWEQVLHESKLPHTEFMDHFKKVITSEQFQQLNDDILRGMNINKQEYCNADHHTLQKAKDRLHALLTSTMMGDVEYILDKSLEESKNKLTTLSNAKDQLDNQNKITTSKKAEKRRLIYLLEKAKGNLIDSMDAKKGIRKDTIGQLIQFLGQNELYTPRSDDG